jgi:hypothetical protein
MDISASVLLDAAVLHQGYGHRSDRILPALWWGLKILTEKSRAESGHQ